MAHGTTRASTEERRLRALIEQLQREQQTPPVSDDVFYASGAYSQLLRGAAALRAAQGWLQEARRNFARTSTVERVVLVGPSPSPMSDNAAYRTC